MSAGTVSGSTVERAKLPAAYICWALAAATSMLGSSAFTDFEKVTDVAADNLLEGQADEIGEAAVGGANFTLE